MWVNNFRRWQKRWLVAGTPGVLVIYRRASRNGTPTTIDLSQATVVVAERGNARQFLIVTGRVLFRVRTLTKEYRQPWWGWASGLAHDYD